MTDRAPAPPDALAPSHLLLETVLESQDACMAITDPQGIIVCANTAWRTFPGGNPFLDGATVGSNYLATCTEMIRTGGSDLSIVALGIRSVLTGKVPRLSLDYPLRSAAGTTWFGMVGDRSVAPGLGAVIRQRDITDRMTMEQRLRRSESLFHLTTENARDLIAILATNGQVRYRSPSHRKTLGYSEQELNSTPMFELIHPEDRPAFENSLRQGARNGLTSLFEYRMRHRDGSHVLFEAQAAVVEHGGGDPEAVLLVSRDITQRKAVEQERAQMEIQLRHAQKMEAVGQLAAGIAHEINTPTQFVGDNLRFLQDSFQSLAGLAQAGAALAEHAAADPTLGAEAAALVKQVEAEELDYLREEVPRAIRQSLDGTERVATIVKAMKIFSHPSSEGWVAVDLNQAIENTLIVSRNEWRYVCEVERRFAPDLPDVVCSPGEFNQVMLNLIVNAAHAIGDANQDRPEEKGTITLETRCDGAFAEISVADTGCGIPEGQLAQIWLPFFTTKPVGKGTGQGLSIVHSILTRHRGSIEVSSEVGKGSRFTLRLPLDPSRAEPLP